MVEYSPILSIFKKDTPFFIASDFLLYLNCSPDFIKNGIGKYLILKAIDKVKEIKLQYLYLGYWIEGSDKMNYKGSFNSLEIFTEGTWKLKP